MSVAKEIFLDNEVSTPISTSNVIAREIFLEKKVSTPVLTPMDSAQFGIKVSTHGFEVSTHRTNDWRFC